MPSSRPVMDLWQAVFLGFIEGITEYLPVSSTGHLLLAGRLLGIGRGAESNAYAICIQGGAIAAVLGLYRRRVAGMIRGIVGKDETGKRLFLRILLAFLPAAVIGFLLDDWIEGKLFGLWPVAFAWAVGGVFILLVRKRGPAPGASLEEISPKQALFIGFAQCLALWPGVSRSLATILGGVSLGLSTAAAVEFSFLLGVLTLGAAASYKALSHGGAIVKSYGLAAALLGFASAWLFAALSVKWMVGYLEKKGLALFGYWRLAVALLAAGLLWTGLVEP
ncbi:MAG: undecaprenyl-diphosphate phosphatase [Bdellovibrionota bacterium]